MQDGLGPTAARSQHVAVGEAATDGKAHKVFERNAAGEQIGHMHVVSFKACTRPSHFGLRVDALLAQDGHLRTHARGNVGSCNALFIVKRCLHEKALHVLVAHPVGFAVGASGIVAVAGNGVGNFAPSAGEIRTGFAKNFRTAREHHKCIVAVEFANGLEDRFEPFGLDFGHHFVETIGRYLQDCTEFFAKERFKRAAAQSVGVERDAAVRSKHHFSSGRRKAAVGAVVVSQHAAGKRELAHETHELGKRLGAVHVGRHVAEALHALRQSRSTHAILAETQVGRKKHALDILSQLGSERQANVAHRSGRRNNKRNGAGHALGFFAVLPGGAH